jgi:chromosome segregation ATPase
MEKRTPTRASKSSTQTKCEELETELFKQYTRLNNFEEKLDDFLSEPGSSLEEISNVTGYIVALKKEINQLEAEQRRLGCLQVEPPTISFDNQTIISTSSVRRKTNADLSETISASQQAIK